MVGFMPQVGLSLAIALTRVQMYNPTASKFVHDGVASLLPAFLAVVNKNLGFNLIAGESFHNSSISGLSPPWVYSLTKIVEFNPTVCEFFHDSSSGVFAESYSPAANEADRTAREFIHGGSPSLYQPLQATNKKWGSLI